MEGPIKGETLLATYQVGFGKPPLHTRFRKGHSGNPAGKLPGTPNKVLPFAPEHQPSDQLILAEAYRPVTIREGDRLVELPALQAAVRAMAIAAMKGSRLAQRSLAELVLKIEQRQASEHQSAVATVIDYQQVAWSELTRRKALGITGLPDPVPHPDDIVIDPHSGDIHFEGPRDEREKQRYETAQAMRAEAQAKVNTFARQHRKVCSDEAKADLLKLWHEAQWEFDLLNDRLPGRYKAKLANRSFAEGASREGGTLEWFAGEGTRYSVSPGDG